MVTDEVKAVILLRNSDSATSVEDFREELAAVAPLGESVAGVRHHLRSLTLLGGYRKGAPLYDAVDEVYFESEAEAVDAVSRLRAVAWPAAARVDLFLAYEYLSKPGQKPAGGVKSFEFVIRKPGMSVEDFGRYWQEVHGPIAVDIATIRRYVQTHALAAEYADAAQPVWDGAAQTWFADVDAMREAGAGSELAATRADEENFLAHPLRLPMLITTEEELSI